MVRRERGGEVKERESEGRGKEKCGWWVKEKGSEGGAHRGVRKQGSYIKARPRFMLWEGGRPKEERLVWINEISQKSFAGMNENLNT